MSEQPNVLLIITDQHRPDHTGFGGNDIVQTPHLDGLAARGTVFDRAYVANPICMPNRSTMLTGRQPSIHGVRYNGIALDDDANTFVRVLRSHGYWTGLVGKAHLQNMGYGTADMFGSFFPQTGDATLGRFPEGWDLNEDLQRHKDGWVEIAEDYYGWDHVDLVVSHSDQCSGHYYQWLLEQGVDPELVQGREHAKQSFDGWDQVYQTSLPEELYPTSYIAQRTVAQLEGAAAGGAPFFLQCSFPDPHHPFTPPGRYYDMYDPADMVLPRTFDDAHTESMPHMQRLLERRGRSNPIPVAPFSPSEDQYRHAAAAEYGMISMIDDAVGEVLGSLERLGLAEDTIVIFTSDHGDMFGDHAAMLKGGMHYEGCIRVPLVVSTPDHAPARTSSLVGTLDLAQTVLDLTGCPEFLGMQGVSMAPLLADPSATVRDHVLVEEDEAFDLALVGQPLRMRTLITDDARLTVYRGTERGELFDLSEDPDETVNLFAHADTRGKRADLTEQLALRLVDYADESPRPTAFA